MRMPVRAGIIVVPDLPDNRCCACGDKVKDFGEMSIGILWDDGTWRVLETWCVDHFMNGHPDEPGSRAHGLIEGLEQALKEVEGA